MYVFSHFIAADLLTEMVRCLVPSLFIPERIGKCIADPETDFMKKHGECVIGALTPEEQVWSDNILKTWTNFAIHG